MDSRKTQNAFDARLAGALGLVLLSVVAAPPRASATEILWKSWSPRVFDLSASDSATLTVVVDSDPATLDIVLTTTGCIPTGVQLDSIPLLPVSARTYEATLTGGQLLHDYQDGDAHAIVGCLERSGEPQSHVVIGVRTPAMPDVPIRPIGLDAQVSIHVVNLRSDELLLGSHISTDLLYRFYLHFADEFDFLATLDQVDTTTNRSYFGMRNEIEGIGLSLFDHRPSLPPRLRGTISYPIDSFFDAASLATTHELGHRWMAYLGNPGLTSGVPHWPISDLAYGVMGWSHPGGAGAQFPFHMTEQPDGSYRLDRISPADEFNDLELYLMGLVEPAAVADHIVLQNQDQRDQVTHGGILQGPVEVIGIGDVIAANGPRVPGVGDAQTDFRLGTIVLSHGRLLDESEMAFFDHMAARGAARDELPFTGGLVRGTAKPFFLATGGRATLSTTVLDAVEAPLDVFILVDLSGSFADDLAVFQEQASGVISSIAASNSNVRFGLGKYEDYPIAPFGQTDPARGDTAYELVLDLTGPDAVLTAIANLPIPLSGDGGDGPQSQLAALFQAATGSGQDLSAHGFPGASIPPGQQANFRPTATKLFLLWTDAEFHHPGDAGDIPYPGPSLEETVAAIAALDPPKVIGISSGSGGLADLQLIAEATGALAPSGGVDCDADGSIDIPEGEALVCETASSGEGIGEAIVMIVDGAVESERPVARCADAEVVADPGACESVVSVDDGSFDPDGGPVTVFQSPPGPYSGGETAVVLHATDQSGLTGSCSASVSVVDLEPPVPACNAPATIVPPDAPISFTATASDNCRATVEVAEFDCFKIQRRGRRVDKRHSCEVAIAGDKVTILDSGGVNTHITWTVVATDDSGLAASTECEVVVANPALGAELGWAGPIRDD